MFHHTKYNQKCNACAILGVILIFDNASESCTIPPQVQAGPTPVRHLSA